MIKKSLDKLRNIIDTDFNQYIIVSVVFLLFFIKDVGFNDTINIHILSLEKYIKAFVLIALLTKYILIEKTKKNLVYFALSTLIYSISVVTTKDLNIFIFINILLVFTVKANKISKLIDFLTVLNLLSFILIVLLSNTSLICTTFITQGELIRYTFGFNHPNGFAFHFFVICTFLGYKKELRNWKIGLPLTLLTFLVYSYSKSRTFLMITLIFLTIFFFENFVKKIIENKKVKLFVINLFLILSISTLILVLLNLYFPNRIVSLIDNVLSSRISLATTFLNRYGIHAFGNEVIYGTVNIPHVDFKYTILDNTYMYILINFGFVMLLTVLLLVRTAIKKLYDQNQFYPIFLFILFLTYGMTEKFFIYYIYCIPIIMFSSILEKRIETGKNGTIVIWPEISNQNLYVPNFVAVLRKEYSVYAFDNIGLVTCLLETDIVHLNWFESIYATTKLKSMLIFIKRIFLLLLFKIFKMKVVWTVHNKKPHDGSFNDKYSNKLIELLCRYSDRIHLLNRDTVHLAFLKDYQSKLYFADFGDYFNNYGYKKMSDLFAFESKLNFLFFGAVRPYKNIELLIESFKKSKLSKYSLTICGKPLNKDYGELLKSKCNESNIKFMFDFVPDSEVGYLLDCHDLLILPYNLDSSLNSATQWLAFSYSKTIVIPNIESVTSMKDHSFIYNYDVEHEDNHEKILIDMLDKVYDDYQEDSFVLEKKGKLALEYMRNNNSWDKISEDWIDLFRF